MFYNNNINWRDCPYMRHIIVLISLFFLQVQNVFSQSEVMGPDSTTTNRVLKGGWYHWDPYQYLKVPGDNASLTGLDVELEKLIMQKAGFPNIKISLVSWKQHQEDLKNGTKDFAMGAFYSEERAKVDYISEPYRYEENSLYVLRKDISKHIYTNAKEFLKYIKDQKLKIGVVDGYRYASDDINNFIANPANKDNIVPSPTDNENLSLLLNGKVDGFLADRIVGATIIWREKIGRQVSEKRLDVKAPIYMLLSKKSITPEEFKKINTAITQLKDSPEYVRTVAWYLYPILLLETTDSEWFSVIEIIGMIAFALSGLVVGYRCGASLFGTFILCLLPSFGGGVLRDVVFGRFPVWFMAAKQYLILVIVIAIIGFFGMRLYTKYGHVIRNLIPKNHFNPTKIFDVLLEITDAAGLAAFTVTGVLVSLIVKADPLWLWGPFFAFLTGAGGGAIRDLFVKEHKVTIITGGLYAESAIFWGLMLSLYLTFTASDVDPQKIEIAVISTIVLGFLGRVLIYFYKIPNIYIVDKKSK
jgi:polar amino acid transport system substrate-binding protein